MPSYLCYTEEAPPEAKPLPEPEPVKKTGAYVPRNQPPGGRGPGRGPYLRPGQRRNAPPDIKNAEAFPSLS